jgi:hypothetical protein
VSCWTVRARFDTNNNIPPVSLRCILSGRRLTSDRADMHTRGKNKKLAHHDNTQRQTSSSSTLHFITQKQSIHLLFLSTRRLDMSSWDRARTSAAREISCVRSVSDLRNRVVGVQGISCPLRWILSRTP